MTLSVACGDTSPKGGGCKLSLWESWHGASRD